MILCFHPDFGPFLFNVLRLFRKLKRTLGSVWPITCFTLCDGSGVKSSTPSQNMFYGLWLRFKFRTNGNILGVAGPGQQCRRSAFSDRPATQIGHGSKKALPVRRFLQTCDGLTADLRRLGLSPATSLLSKANTHGFILDPLLWTGNVVGSTRCRFC